MINIVMIISQVRLANLDRLLALLATYSDVHCIYVVCCIVCSTVVLCFNICTCMYILL